MTEERAQEMLKELSNHYRTPVRPLYEFCEAVSAWMRCIEKANEEPRAEHESAQGSEYWALLRRIEMDISKSGLLWRLLYLGEKVRAKKCPQHNGHMNLALWVDGGASPVMQMAIIDGVATEIIRRDGCPHGCGGTGWLKEP